MTNNQRVLCVLDAEGTVQKVPCRGMAFDGGALIIFHDEAQTSVTAAFGPGGWLYCHWDTPNGS